MENYTTKDIVKKYGFKFTKSLGQNFLIDDSVLFDIVDGAEINNNDTIIEIGPGVGTLTRELLKKAKKVYSIELDDELLPILKEELKDFNNFVLIHQDALKVNFNDVIDEQTSIKVVANLPYYVTTPIITKILKEDYDFKSLTIMIQKEVAERFLAKCDTKEYGSITLLVQYYCDIIPIRKVAPSSFIPRPKVESMVIKMNKLAQKRVIVKNEDLFFRVIRLSFNFRRKTLWNALKGLKLNSDVLRAAFKNANIDEKRRGETLSMQEFGVLSDCINELM